MSYYGGRHYEGGRKESSDSRPAAGRVKGGSGLPGYYGAASGPAQEKVESRSGHRGGNTYGKPGQGDVDEVDAELDYQHRIQAANRRMEESSTKSYQTLQKSLHVGIQTAEELSRQRRTMDRIEVGLDGMGADLHQSGKDLRNIRSAFGGVRNFFARRRPVRAETDPTASAPSGKKSSGPPGKSKQEGVSGRSSSRVKAGKKTGETAPSISDASGGEGARGYGPARRGTGNEVVDENLDGMERALYQLRGVGRMISDQLQDSNKQVVRLHTKLDHSKDKLKKRHRELNYCE